MRTKSALVSALLALLSILASASAYTYTYPSYQGGENLYGLENSSELNKIVQLQIFNLIYGARLKYTPGKFIEPDISFRLRDFLRTNWTARGYSNQIPIDYFLETNIYTANLDLVVQFGDGDLYRLNWATLDVTGILNASGSANSGVPTGYYNVTPVFEDLFSQNLSQNDFSIQNLKNILDPLNDQFYCVQESHSVNPDS